MNKQDTEILSPRQLAVLTKAFPPTEEQEEVIKAPLVPLLVVAGAGSGKTETIASRLVYWVVNRAIPPQSVLGLTFTKKATAEMRQRFNLRLENLALSMEQAEKNPNLFAAEVIRFLEKHPDNYGTDAWAFCQELKIGMQKLQEQGMTPQVLRGGVEVSTYDSLASTLLSEFGALIGRDPGYRVITQGTRFQIMSNVLETWTSGLTYREEDGAYMGKLVEGLLSLAGDVNAHVVDLNCLKETYQNVLDAAQNELKASEELDAELEPLQEAKKSAKKAGDKVLEKALANQIKDYELPLSAVAKKDLARTIEVMRFGLDAVEIIRTFNSRKKKMHFADFADQTRAVVELVKQIPSVSQSYQKRYQLVLLDEFQDTSVAQLKYLSTLFKNQPVTAVGDPNQAIYGWRGASAASIEDFPAYFSDNPQKVLSLTLKTSWRNDAAILKVANRIAAEIAKQNQEKNKSNNFTMPDLELRPGVDQNSGTVLGANFLCDEDEAKAVAGFLQKWKKDLQIAQEHMQQWIEKGKIGEAPSLPTAAVLCRKKSMMEPVIKELSRQGIPYQLRAAEGALRDPGVILVRAVLDLITNPDNSGSLLTLLDRFRISRPDLETLSKAAGRNQSIFEIVMSPEACKNISPQGCSRLAILRGIISRLNSHLPYATPLQMMRIAHRLFGLDIEQEIPGTPYHEEAFDIFLGMAADFERSGQATLREFLEWLKVAQEEEKETGQLEEPVDKGKVQVITVHAAKGLEWDYVAIPSLNKGTFPDEKSEIWLKDFFTLPYPLRGDKNSLPKYKVSVRKTGDKDRSRKYLEQFEEQKYLYRLKEEANLAYVAFTRAKSHLFLSTCWFKSVNTKPIEPGVFFQVLTGSKNSLFEWKKTKSTDKEVKDERAADYIEKAGFLRLPREELGNMGIAFCPDMPNCSNPNEKVFEAGLWQVPSWLDMDASVEQEHIPNWNVSGLQRSYQTVQSAMANLPKLESLMQSAPGSLSWRVGKLLTAPRHHVDVEKLLTRIAATSVTKLETSEEEFILQKLRPLPLEPSSATRLGVIMHAWIAEQLGQPTLDIPDGNETSLDQESQEKLSRYRETWENLEFLRDKAVVDVELNGSLILGQGRDSFEIPLRIDAVLQDRNQGTVWIADWKTEYRTKPENYDKKLHQLGIYRLYWLQNHPELNPDQVKCAYVFLKETNSSRQILSLDQILEGLNLEEYSTKYLQQILQRGQAQAQELLMNNNL